MQDNHMDEIWRDKLGGYQAPADPQDWADMAAMLDAQEEKRAGFFWWWLVAAALVVTVGGGLFHLMQVQSEQIDAFAISGSNGTNNDNGNTNAIDINGIANTTGSENSVSSSNIDPNENNSHNTGNDAKGQSGNNTLNTTTAASTNGSDSNEGNIAINNTTSKNNKGSKNSKRNKKGNATSNQNNNVLAANSGTLNGNGNINAQSSNSGSPSTNAETNSNGGSNGYDAPVGTISVKRLKQLPNELNITLAQSHDTTKFNFNDHLMKRRVVQHYLGLSTGWVHSRVDRSGDFRPGYNIGLQYTMMVKNRAGFHVGLAFRQYRYYTDLVACNYDIYQCPNSYSSTLQTIDLNVGAQVNLVKTDKVEWYVMGGVSNQFMMNEEFEYNLPAIDTTAPVPNIPPTNTSFTGAGVSDFESSIDASFDVNSLVTSGNAETGKFLRERYLGAWYVGTGVTWNFASRMNLQVEPVIGRSFQFVGIQDKKLWQTGVNVRMNVRLSR